MSTEAHTTPITPFTSKNVEHWRQRIEGAGLICVVGVHVAHEGTGTYQILCQADGALRFRALYTVEEAERYLNRVAAGTEALEEMILEERRQQDRRWGGAVHDDQHSAEEWKSFVLTWTKKMLEVGVGLVDTQVAALVDVAALGYAIADCLDRERRPAHKARMHQGGYSRPEQ